MTDSPDLAQPPRCLVLASASPRRRELLGQLAGDFTVIVSGVPEPIDDRLSPSENLLQIARAKAAAVAKLQPGCIVLAADTDVILDGQILGKPATIEEATAMLVRLGGRDHEVLTAVVVIDPLSGIQREEVTRSLVRIRSLSAEEIAAYVATGEPMDKAGGYAIQGEAASMVEAVDGCFTNVVGLPICSTRRLLEAAGLSIGTTGRCSDPSGNLCPLDLC